MRFLGLLLPLLVGTLLPSCRTFAYQADFEKAVVAAPAVPVDPTGPWKGSWKSNMNDHSGPLWCLVSPSPDQADSYDFRYHAGWGKFEFGDFTHTVPGALTPDKALAITGKMELPGFVGTYSVDGAATKVTFKAKYKSDHGEHGTMTLKRP